MRALAIPGLTSDDDVRWLAAQAAGRDVIVEIGSFKGRSTRALADACPGVVYAIDDWNATLCGHADTGARAAFHANLADLLGTKVIAFEHNSQLGIPAALRTVAVDMLWIDGDHSYAAVRSDIGCFGPLVRPGGLICGHDYSVHRPEVVRAVDEAFGRHRVQTLGIHRSIWWVHA